MRYAALPLLLLIAAACGTAAGPKGQKKESAAPRPREAMAPDSAYEAGTFVASFAPPAGARRVAIPLPLRNRIGMDLRAFIDSIAPPGNDTMLQAELQSSEGKIVFRMRVSDTLSAFIAHLQGLPALNQYFLYLQSATGRICPQPFSYYGAYMQDGEAAFSPPEARLPEQPLFSLTDLDGDGHPEIALRERRHNGNVYNAVVVHYIAIDSSLQLTEIASLEEISGVPLDATNQLRVVRSLRYDPAARQYIISARLWNGSRSEPIGEAWLTPGRAAGRQTVLRRTILLKKYEQLLITASPDGWQQ